jgi:F-type H+-transporting ATPase subunit b
MNALLLLASAGSLTDVRPGLIIWTLVTFVIVAFVLRQVAWTPLLKAVDEREKQITGAIDSAKRERAEAEKLLGEQKSAIAQARQESAELLRKSQAEMERFREEVMGKARKEAEDLKTEARKMIEDERAKAAASLKNEAVGIALQVAEKLLAERLDDAKHRQLAEQFVADLDKQPRA